ncbi:protein phosphatase CheZ [Algihabitans sp.]|uniref:protein phosphatase CheZ n=1 Tax=Algihabitans sp. TaxID=2821514 RepID=UPI003BAC164E
MTALAQQTELEVRLAEFGKRHPKIDPKDLIDVVEAIMTTADGDLSSVNLKLYAEIEQLAVYIQRAREEIACLRPDEITAEHLPVAGEELEAVVGATEQATNTIMESVETIEGLTDQMPREVSEQVVDAVTQVYEACGFQDITGQRIKKVVSTLTQIEEKVHALLGAFGQDGQIDAAKAKASKAEKPKEEAAPPTDADLLNGPQMAENAISQEDIDALLASFD